MLQNFVTRVISRFRKSAFSSLFRRYSHLARILFTLMSGIFRFLGWQSSRKKELLHISTRKFEELVHFVSLLQVPNVYKITQWTSSLYDEGKSDRYQQETKRTALQEHKSHASFDFRETLQSQIKLAESVDVTKSEFLICFIVIKKKKHLKGPRTPCLVQKSCKQTPDIVRFREDKIKNQQKVPLCTPRYVKPVMKALRPTLRYECPSYVKIKRVQRHFLNVWGFPNVLQLLGQYLILKGWIEVCAYCFGNRCTG